MVKKIEGLGIQLDNYTVREAMLLVEGYLSGIVMNTVEEMRTEAFPWSNLGK